MRKAIVLILLIVCIGGGALADLYVHFLDVGQGDAAIVIADEAVMMIDGGDAKHSSLIYTYLRDTLKIDNIDVMIATHPHADHAGGLSAALNACTVGVIYTPEIAYDTKTWNNVLRYAEAQGTPVIIPMPGDEFDLGGATVEILGPVWFSNDTNNLSLVLRVTYGEMKFLFTGDAEWDEEHDLVDAGVDLRADVLKVPHHGSNSSSSYVFLRAVNPRHAIISVGKDNSYGHPDEEVLGRLRNLGAQVYRTDEMGTIRCRTDGKRIAFRTER